MTGEEDVFDQSFDQAGLFRSVDQSEQFNEGVVLIVLTALSGKHAHDQYIVFKNNKDDRIHAVIQEMLKETYEKPLVVNESSAI